MLWLILSIIVGIVLFVCLGYDELPNGKVSWGIKFRQLFSLAALLILLPGCITKVPVNSVGIKYSPFNGTSETTLSEGFHFKNPLDKVYKISTEVQTKTVENLTTQTRDAQYINSILDIKYKVNASNAFMVFKQYRTLNNMSDNFIVPTAQRVLEQATTQYNVIDILGEKRTDIYGKLEKDLAEEFVSITINDMDAGAAIEQAITAEAVAKKAVETAEQELLKAETEAKQKGVLAKAEQEAAKIEAETKIIQAQAEKEANELLQQSLTEAILKQLWIEKWNGEVPTYYGGDGADLIFNTGEIE